MNPLVVVLVLFLPAVTLAVQSCTVPEAGFTDWVPITGCSDVCGGCGSQFWGRTCKTPPCTGPMVQSRSCAFTVCKFPKKSCCTGKRKMKISKTFFCL